MCLHKRQEQLQSDAAMFLRPKGERSDLQSKIVESSFLNLCDRNVLSKIFKVKIENM